MAAPLTKTKIAGDVIKYFDSNEFCFDEATLTNEGLVALTDFDIGGRPVVYDGTTASIVEVGLATFDDADANGIIAEKGHIDTLAPSGVTTRKYVILVRGPAVTWQSGMDPNDPTGTPHVFANLATALLAENILQRPGGGAIGANFVT